MEEIIVQANTERIKMVEEHESTTAALVSDREHLQQQVTEVQGSHKQVQELSHVREEQTRNEGEVDRHAREMKLQASELEKSLIESQEPFTQRKKYGGSGMVYLLEHLFRVVWHEEVVPKEWREGLIFNLFNKGDKEEPGNYRGITLLSVVGKVFCRYDTVWRADVWLKLWDMGVKGKMWRVVKGMYEVSRSAVLLDGEKSNILILV